MYTCCWFFLYLNYEHWDDDDMATGTCFVMTSTKGNRKFVQLTKHLNATCRPDTDARSRGVRGYSPRGAYVRAPLYRVVGIIHVASGRVKVVIPRALQDTFLKFYSCFNQASAALRLTAKPCWPRSDGGGKTQHFFDTESEFGPGEDW